MDAFQGLSIYPGTFLLPRKDIRLEKWAVLACDQYTAQPEKWEEADRLIGSAPSALRMIIPEAYLEESAARVPAVQQAMKDYLKDGILEEAVHGMVLLARQTQSGTRLGLVLTVDLEDYDFASGSRSPIRPTEGTILSRIPPRQKVRRGAALELSHVLLLCDDPERTVIEPLYEKRASLRLLYDTPLMLEGGHITGWAVEDPETLRGIAGAIQAMKDRTPEGGILFAVGDGNHSLATARAHWLELKESLPEEARAHHPARYAMVELNNIYDPSLIFEPIHRVLFGVTGPQVLDMLAEAGLTEEREHPDLTLVTAEGDSRLKITHPLHELPVGTVQQLLDRVTELKLDYVHGEAAVRQLVQAEHAVGILLPAMDKGLLFPAVANRGPLPRKTFSMGEANEKRFYLEARKII